MAIQARAPGNVDGWAGNGAVWFKLWEEPAVTNGGQSISFPSDGKRHKGIIIMQQLTCASTGKQNFVFTLPRSLPSGQCVDTPIKS